MLTTRNYPFGAILHTGGDGLWGAQKSQVFIKELQMFLFDADITRDSFGELRLYFDPKIWDIRKYGLIYTDKLFIVELHKLLTKKGFDGSDVDYSEQGMQGDDYVSCDVGKDFILSWFKIVGQNGKEE